MSHIFITGSSDGLGLLAAKFLIEHGHKVVVHARNEERAEQTLRKLPGAEKVLIADLSKIEETKKLSEELNTLEKFDSIIHNAGVYNASSKELLNVNTLAPYILTCLVQRPQRLIYLSSGMHKGGNAKFESFQADGDRINYSDTKLHVLLLCKAVASRWTDVYSNAVNPGWVPTKMGGRGAPDDLQKGFETQVWLATSNDEDARVSGQYFFHKKPIHSNPDADNIILQEAFLNTCAAITGVSINSG